MKGHAQRKGLGEKTVFHGGVVNLKCFVERQIMPFIERIKPVQEKTGINIKKLVELLREHCVKARGNHGRISAVRLKQRIQFCRLHKLLGKTHVNELCYAYHMAGGLKAWRRLMNT